MQPEIRTFSRLATEWFSRAKNAEELARQRYRNVRAVTGFWAILDLKGSAAFRQKHGVQGAFTRAQVFSQLVNEIAAGSETNLRVFKEMGDGQLLFASEFRPLLELILVIQAVDRYWFTDVLNDPTYPSLESRAAITFGQSHVLDSDYLGSPIDTVARISGYKALNEDCVAVVSDEVRSREEKTFEAEYPFVRFAEPTPLPSQLLKSGEANVWISEVLVDRTALRDFSDFFSDARRALEVSRFPPAT